MQRRSPEARFEMKRTKMPRPDTTKSVCNYTSKEFQIFFQTLLSLSSMASKVFLKTQFQDGSFKSPLAATSIVENISYKPQKIQDFFVVWLFQLGQELARLLICGLNPAILELILFHNLYNFYICSPHLASFISRCHLAKECRKNFFGKVEIIQLH